MESQLVLSIHPISYPNSWLRYPYLDSKDARREVHIRRLLRILLGDRNPCKHRKPCGVMVVHTE